VYEIIRGVDTPEGFLQMVLVKNIAFNYFGSGKSSRETLSVASKTPDGMAGLEQAGHKASADISRGAGY
jgi:hypothetical protein